MKILAPGIHGYLDYVIVLMLFVAPTLFGFEGTPSVICYVLGSMQLVMSLMTAYPLGAAKIIPFPIHGGVEVVTAIFLVAAPRLFNFNAWNTPRNFFLVAGLSLAVLWLITDYKAAESDVPVTSRRRRTA